MSRTVFCKKYQEELEALDAPPYPGPKGQEIFESVSKKAWQDCLAAVREICAMTKFGTRKEAEKMFVDEDANMS